MRTKIIFCGCRQWYQDKTYGRGMRVHNYGDRDKIWRCTGCGAEFKTQAPTAKKKDDKKDGDKKGKKK